MSAQNCWQNITIYIFLGGLLGYFLGIPLDFPPEDCFFYWSSSGLILQGLGPWNASIYDRSKNNQETQDCDCIVRGYIYVDHNNKDNSIKTPITARDEEGIYTLFI